MGAAGWSMTQLEVAGEAGGRAAGSDSSRKAVGGGPGTKYILKIWVGGSVRCLEKKFISRLGCQVSVAGRGGQWLKAAGRARWAMDF